MRPKLKSCSQIWCLVFTAVIIKVKMVRIHKTVRVSYTHTEASYVYR